MNPVREERAAAAAQIQRSLKAWRSASGAAGKGGVPKTTGSPLPTGVRSRMEPRLGGSLGNVRVHTGSESAEAATGFGARAFTVGEDVHFNAGEFQPGSKEGDKLLAHELAHVVQGQKSGVQRKAEDDEKKPEGKEDGEAEVSDPSEPAEKEADATAEDVAGDLHGEDREEKEAAGEEGATEKKEGGEGKQPKIAAKLEGIGAKIMRVEDPTKKKAKAIIDIKAKAATFANMQCVECAEALKTILTAAGVKGTMITLTNKPKNKAGFVYCISKKMNISASNFHVGVAVDGTVYDNQHPGGMGRAAWTADFAHMKSPDGGAAAFEIAEAGF